MAYRRSRSMPLFINPVTLRPMSPSPRRPSRPQTYYVNGVRTHLIGADSYPNHHRSPSRLILCGPTGSYQKLTNSSSSFELSRAGVYRAVGDFPRTAMRNATSCEDVFRAEAPTTTTTWGSRLSESGVSLGDSHTDQGSCVSCVGLEDVDRASLCSYGSSSAFNEVTCDSEHDSASMAGGGGFTYDRGREVLTHDRSRHRAGASHRKSRHDSGSREKFLSELTSSSGRSSPSEDRKEFYHSTPTKRGSPVLSIFPGDDEDLHFPSSLHHDTLHDSLYCSKDSLLSSPSFTRKECLHDSTQGSIRDSIHDSISDSTFQLELPTPPSSPTSSRSTDKKKTSNSSSTAQETEALKKTLRKKRDDFFAAFRDCSGLETQSAGDSVQSWLTTGHTHRHIPTPFPSSDPISDHSDTSTNILSSDHTSDYSNTSTPVPSFDHTSVLRNAPTPHASSDHPNTLPTHDPIVHPHQQQQRRDLSLPSGEYGEGGKDHKGEEGTEQGEGLEKGKNRQVKTPPASHSQAANCNDENIKYNVAANPPLPCLLREEGGREREEGGRGGGEGEVSSLHLDPLKRSEAGSLLSETPGAPRLTTPYLDHCKTDGDFDREYDSGYNQSLFSDDTSLIIPSSVTSFTNTSNSTCSGSNSDNSNEHDNSTYNNGNYNSNNSSSNSSSNNSCINNKRTSTANKASENKGERSINDPGDENGASEGQIISCGRVGLTGSQLSDTHYALTTQLANTGAHPTTTTTPTPSTIFSSTISHNSPNTTTFIPSTSLSTTLTPSPSLLLQSANTTVPGLLDNSADVYHTEGSQIDEEEKGRTCDGPQDNASTAACCDVSDRTETDGVDSGVAGNGHIEGESFPAGLFTDGTDRRVELSSSDASPSERCGTDQRKGTQSGSTLSSEWTQDEVRAPDMKSQYYSGHHSDRNTPGVAATMVEVRHTRHVHRTRTIVDETVTTRHSAVRDKVAGHNTMPSQDTSDDAADTAWQAFQELGNFELLNRTVMRTTVTEEDSDREQETTRHITTHHFTGFERGTDQTGYHHSSSHHSYPRTTTTDTFMSPEGVHSTEDGRDVSSTPLHGVDLQTQKYRVEATATIKDSENANPSGNNNDVLNSLQQQLFSLTLDGPSINDNRPSERRLFAYQDHAEASLPETSHSVFVNAPDSTNAVHGTGSVCITLDKQGHQTQDLPQSATRTGSGWTADHLDDGTGASDTARDPSVYHAQLVHITPGGETLFPSLHQPSSSELDDSDSHYTSLTTTTTTHPSYTDTMSCEGRTDDDTLSQGYDFRSHEWSTSDQPSVHHSMDVMLEDFSQGVYSSPFLHETILEADDERETDEDTDSSPDIHSFKTSLHFSVPPVTGPSVLTVSPVLQSTPITDPAVSVSEDMDCDMPPFQGGSIRGTHDLAYELHIVHSQDGPELHALQDSACSSSEPSGPYQPFFHSTPASHKIPDPGSSQEFAQLTSPNKPGIANLSSAPRTSKKYQWVHDKILLFQKLLNEFDSQKKTSEEKLVEDMVALEIGREENTSDREKSTSGNQSELCDDLYSSFTREFLEKRQNHVCPFIEEHLPTIRFKRFLKKKHNSKLKSKKTFRIRHKLEKLLESSQGIDADTTTVSKATLSKTRHAPYRLHQASTTLTPKGRGRIVSDVFIDDTDVKRSFSSDSAYSSLSSSRHISDMDSTLRSVDSNRCDVSSIGIDVSMDCDKLRSLSDVFEQTDVCQDDVDDARLDRLRVGHYKAETL